MDRLLAIIQDTFREARSKKTMLAFFILSTLVMALTLLFFLTGKNLLLQAPVAGGRSLSPDTILREVVTTIEVMIARALYAPAILLSIFATAGILPQTMEKGSIDLLLSKPVSRSLIVTGKIAGATIMVFLNIVYYIFGMWLIISATTGIWNTGFLATILPITFAFLVLYSLTAFFGILTRSSAVSILIVYFLFIIFFPLLASRQAFLFTMITQAAVRDVLDVLYYIFPKTDDVAAICGNLITGAPIQWLPVWTSAIFAALFFAASYLMFLRKDF